MGFVAKEIQEKRKKNVDFLNFQARIAWKNTCYRFFMFFSKKKKEKKKKQN